MGEIDTKPIEPVQVGITLFDDKTDRRKLRPGGGTTSTANSHEMEIEELHKELASYKVELQAKDAAYSQLLHKLEHHQKTEEQLSIRLKNSEIERDVYFEEYNEAQNQINELETKMKEMSDQLSELKAVQDDKLEALTTIQELESQLMAKKLFIDSLQVELSQANELLSSSDKVFSDVINDFDKLKNDLKDKENENYDQVVRIRVLETEIEQLKLELRSANDEITRLNCEVETVTDELEKAKMSGRARNAKNEEETTERVTISVEEYEGILTKKGEMEIMKKEMEAATAKVAEFRTRAEQARARAEAAETAKMGLEDQLRKWREQKQRRKAALAALREESLSREFGTSSYETATTPRNFQPLGKALNMKF